ncbi:CAP-Gly domain-containing linker protein 4-like isoform X4 [Dermacentor andersoni]|uniref:CAP-Gly domain-containing linker protein 4-like isoform X4 n=1 Tax=Dermacentor andersoni TaxID=34620 RepID=UPI0021554923|nr:CAP-Gly domain-containing linker protein 4-like isoform X4 [Dermacentor andersoni]
MGVGDAEDSRDGARRGSHVSRQHAIVYQPTDAPACPQCRMLDVPFFDTDCPNCLNILHSEDTTVPEIFAILRQWVPRTQKDIKTLCTEVLKRGAHVNDRDGLTDMTLLHYACKSGATGVGDLTSSTQTVGILLDYGADPTLRCRWTDMAPLHYAAYFDVPPVIELLLKATKRSECVPEMRKGEALPSEVSTACNMRDLLRCSLPPGVHSSDGSGQQQEAAPSPSTGRVLLQSLGLKIGDKVTVGGSKVGTLRYCGTIHFATGIWAGVELCNPLGKNDGSLGGVSYFQCPMNHGIFAPITKIQKYDGGTQVDTVSSPTKASRPPKSISYPKVDVSHVSSKIETGLSTLRQKQHLYDRKNNKLSIGDSVVVGQRKGVVRFLGETQFAPAQSEQPSPERTGYWCGIELAKPEGKNNGSVNGVTYFTCPPNHGVFAQPLKVKWIPPGTDEEASDLDSLVDLNTSISRSSTDGDSGGSPASQRSTSTDKKPPAKSQHAKTVQTVLKKGCWLTVGMNVFVCNELGVIRYIGPVHFEEGTWLGVELRGPTGRNDGSVQGRRYFTCKPNHGLIVRPNKVTVRGINSAKLFEEQPHS